MNELITTYTLSLTYKVLGPFKTSRFLTTFWTTAAESSARSIWRSRSCLYHCMSWVAVTLQLSSPWSSQSRCSEGIV